MAAQAKYTFGHVPNNTRIYMLQAPSSLLDALEQHLASMEGKKGSAANTPTQTARYIEFDRFNFI